MITKRCLFLLLPLALVLVAGCGTNTRTAAKLSGSIKYNGKPITAGMVTIHPQEGGAYPATFEKGGTYLAGGLPVGEVTITVETESANPNKPKASSYGGGKAGAGGASPMPKDVQPAAQPETGPYVQIPAKYGNKETSKLTATLKAGANTADFDLTN